MAAAADLRRRRGGAPSDDGGDAPTATTTTTAKRAGAAPRQQQQQQMKKKAKTMTFQRAFFVLVIARAASAVVNIVHDCDETFNFWEPLHYLVHGYGLQTWEHSPEFALRSYLYLGLHWLVAKPISMVTGDARGKLFTFISVRMALGVASAASEAWLCAEVARLNAFAGAMLTALLAWSAGMFAASTAFLPSSFAMYCVTTAAAASLARRHGASCAACVVAVVWGWPFAGIAAIPFGLDSLAHVGFLRTAAAILLPLVAAAGASVAVDSYFYGRVTSSTLNILRYNVAGGGSELYGVEGATFYLRNLFNGFTLALPLALAAPLLVLASAAFATRSAAGDDSNNNNARAGSGFGRLMVAFSPFPLALAFFSSVAHKEERFMYMVYPLLCLGASVALAAGVDVAAKLRRALKMSGLTLIAALGAAAAAAVVLVFSVSRVAALTHGYGAPMAVYPSLPVPVIPKGGGEAVIGGGGGAAAAAGGGVNFTVGVCVGGEWYRFPSSFHLPSPAYRLRFVESSFDGALPVPFDAAAGGTRFAPAGLNDKNQGDPLQRAKDPWGVDGDCHFVVDVNLEGVAPAIAPSKVVKRKMPPPHLRRKRTGGSSFSNDDEQAVDEEDDENPWKQQEEEEEVVETGGAGGSSRWEVVREVEFLDQANSPSLSRAFFVPGWSYGRNKYGTYRVYRRVTRSKK